MEQYKKFQCVHILKTRFITSMALSPDGTIFACGQTDNYTCKDQWISVFDLNTGQRIRTFNIFGRAVFADFICRATNYLSATTNYMSKHLVARKVHLIWLS
ncbi:hypothetical protein NIES4075_41100 [Tolypothrix sp. NIES-4075]|uniref:hypothetical protein n=1 Tax=Tolypothrix sp. NIES-4075 TaxID=2005459 RepID=UPI000B5C602C|nr:hypothetical protein [Tolypothrix sp. NIES-4075]GAX43098.1 hypothetical protein NIES4075_41100 [Tolypothrix sp. NIES-4075]